MCGYVAYPTAAMGSMRLGHNAIVLPNMGRSFGIRAVVTELSVLAIRRILVVVQIVHFIPGSIAYRTGHAMGDRIKRRGFIILADLSFVIGYLDL